MTAITTRSSRVAEGNPARHLYLVRQLVLGRHYDKPNALVLAQKNSAQPSQAKLS
jgi:hypothetical protein